MFNGKTSNNKNNRTHILVYSYAHTHVHAVTSCVHTHMHTHTYRHTCMHTQRHMCMHIICSFFKRQIICQLDFAKLLSLQTVLVLKITFAVFSCVLLEFRSDQL